VETRVATKILAKKLGMDNWKTINRLKEVHSNLGFLRDTAKEIFHEGSFSFKGFF